MSSQKPERSQLLLKNGFFSVLSWAAPFSLGFVVTPIIVRGLGSEAFGLYAIVLAFVNYTFSFGVGKAAAKYVAEYKASGDTDKISETVSVVIWISVGMGLLSIIFVSLFSRSILSDVLLIQEEFRDTAETALYIASVSILAMMLSQVFQFVLQGLHRFDLFLLFTNVSGLALNLGNLLLVYAGFGLISLIVWNCVVVTATGAIFYFNANRLLPDLTLMIRIPSASWSRALRYAGSIIVYQICGNVMLLFERGWIVRRFGAEALTYYIVPMLIGFYFHALVSNLCIVIFPVLNELLSDRTRLIRLYKTSTKIIASLVVLFIVSSIISGKVFLAVWVKGDFPARSYDVLVLHVITFSVIAITTVAWQLTESFGKARVNSISALVWMAISVPLMIILSQPWQIFGVALARTIGVAAMLPLIGFVEWKVLRVSLGGFWLRLASKLLLAGLTAGAIQYIVISTGYSDWATLFLTAAFGTLVFYLCLWAIRVLDQDERDTIKAIFNRIHRAVA